MKRISIFLVIVLTGFIHTFAQMEPGASIDYKSLENKLARSDKNLADPKKANLLKTWLDRAKILEEIADVHTKFLRNGMNATEAKIYLKEPKEIKSYGDGKEEYIYERITLTFEGGVLKHWAETNEITQNAKEEAIKAYQKAVELDVEGKNTKKIVEGLKNIRGIYSKLAIAGFNKKDYEMAFINFKNYSDMGELKEINSVDTAFIFYAAITAYYSKKYDEAIKYFNKCAQHNYKDPIIYSTLKVCYYLIGDTVKGFEALNKGIELFPDNQDILVELINHYLSTNESSKALDYLQKAKEKDPTNKTFYFAEGNLYDKMGEGTKAIEVYQKAIELDSSYFLAYFNIGVIYYNNAVKLFEIADKESNNKKYMEKKKISDDEFARAVPYFEKAYKSLTEKPISDDPEQNRNDLLNKKQTLDNLKSLYYRLQMMDKHEKVEKLLKEF